MKTSLDESKYSTGSRRTSMTMLACLAATSLTLSLTTYSGAQPKSSHNRTRLAGIGSLLHHGDDSDFGGDSKEKSKDKDKDKDRDKGKDKERNKDKDRDKFDRDEKQERAVEPEQAKQPEAAEKLKIDMPVSSEAVTPAPVNTEPVEPPVLREPVTIQNSSAPDQPPSSYPAPGSSYPSQPAPVGQQEMPTYVPAMTPQASQQAPQPAEIITAASTESETGIAPDKALMSVLNDLSRTLKEQAELDKVEDANQRAVVAAARQVLAKALEQSNVPKDRIVHDRKLASSSMTTEAWGSGETIVSDNLRGSMSAVWAKHESGMLNVTIAGVSSGKAPNGRRIGEFVVVISAKSPIEKGFDIQTQAEVEFWIAKLSSMAVEASCCTAAPKGDSPQTSEIVEPPERTTTVVLQPVITQRGRQYMTRTGAFSGVEPTELSATGKAAAREAIPKTVLSAEDVREPSANSIMVLPDRVVAGQPITASVMGSNGTTEPSIEFTINGTASYSDKRGHALYTVPEDAIPGKSLHVALKARPDAPETTLEVIHPLSAAPAHQAPKIMRLAVSGTINKIAIIDGHNFDGYGVVNRVTVDAHQEAKILAASPVQIKVLLPPNVGAGVHSFAISVAGLKSPPIAVRIAASTRTAARR